MKYGGSSPIAVPAPCIRREGGREGGREAGREGGREGREDSTFNMKVTYVQMGCCGPEKY